MRRIEIVLGELERLTRGLCLADLAHPPRYGDQIEERVDAADWLRRAGVGLFAAGKSG